MSLFLEKVISDNIAQDGTLATDLTKVCSSFKLVVVVVCLWQYQINLITIKELWHIWVTFLAETSKDLEIILIIIVLSFTNRLSRTSLNLSLSCDIVLFKSIIFFLEDKSSLGFTWKNSRGFDVLWYSL